jgi:HEAT repeat protein
MSASKLPFQKTINELIEGKKGLSRTSLRDFSDMDSESLNALLEAWPRIAPDRKQMLLGELQTLTDNDTRVCFDDFARAILNDPDAQVRISAIHLLEECDDAKLVPIYLKMLSDDPEASARKAAAAALGKFVQLGELEGIPKKTQRRIEEALQEKANGEDQASVRRQALESIGYSARPEAMVLIKSAFQREDPDWQASALSAMGHSSDERWEKEVLPKLLDEIPRVQSAAIEAAGELGLTSAREILLKLLVDEENDDLVSTAIWSLSQIGGEDVRVYLEGLLDQTEDEDQVEFLEEALDNMAFTEDLAKFELLNLDIDDDLVDEEEE